MLGFEIIGTGHYVPGQPVTNDDLSRVMDTYDEWIFKRSGIRQRHYAPEGVGRERPRGRGGQARHRGRGHPARGDRLHRLRDDDAGLRLPGLGRAARAQARARRRARARHPPAVRGDALRAADRRRPRSRAAPRRRSSSSAPRRTPGFMPWEDWDALDPANGHEATPGGKARKANKHRALAVLFGDGAGALIFRATDRDAGLRAIEASHRRRRRQAPLRRGRRLPDAPVLEAQRLRRAEVHPDDGRARALQVRRHQAPGDGARALRGDRHARSNQIDWFLAHQANARINEYVREHLGVPPEKLPIEHRALRQHERRHASDPHRRADARGKAEARADCACCSRSAPASTGAARC